MSDLRTAALWAFAGVAIGLFAFTYNYTMVPMTLPGYDFLAGPAMLALSFFSEETSFKVKLIIFLFGQYLGYFLIIFIIRKIIRLSKLSNNKKQL